MLKSFLRMAHTNQSTMKYVLVTGGVISGIGKGVIASSIGTLLNSCGIVVTSIKIDPYINIDAGTFSPYEHGKQVLHKIRQIFTRTVLVVNCLSLRP
jgi:hypothetical protein